MSRVGPPSSTEDCFIFLTKRSQFPFFLLGVPVWTHRLRTTSAGAGSIRKHGITLKLPDSKLLLEEVSLIFQAEGSGRGLTPLAAAAERGHLEVILTFRSSNN